MKIIQYKSSAKDGIVDGTPVKLIKDLPPCT